MAPPLGSWECAVSLRTQRRSLRVRLADAREFCCECSRVTGNPVVTLRASREKPSIAVLPCRTSAFSPE